MFLDVVESCGREDLATVTVARLRQGGDLIEMVESRQPPHPLAEKWVLIVSTLRGCPVGCPMCDAAGSYRGPLSADEIMAQIDTLVIKRFPNRVVLARKFKIQFARMGEPALNDAVLTVLEDLPCRLQAPGLIPSVSTVAPYGREVFFARLAEIKRQHYANGRFQLQFSVHSTDEVVRRRIVPIRTWTLAQMATYADAFFGSGDRRITLNFVACREYPVDPRVLINLFDPARFLIKITPLNPTERAKIHGLTNGLPRDAVLEPSWTAPLQEAGFQVLLSIGEWEENRIGSNCGQYVKRIRQSGENLAEAYHYRMQPVGEARP